MNKKQTITQHWKCWITSTMVWHWMTNLESWTKILCIDLASYEKSVLCYKCQFIISSCFHHHLQGHQVVINDHDAAKEFSTMLRREWSKFIIKWSLEVCTIQFPKIGRYRHHNIQRCSIHLNKKQTIPQIWKYWITSTMSWHWKLKWNVEIPRVWLSMLPSSNNKFEFVRFPPKHSGAWSSCQEKPVAPRMLMLRCKQTLSRVQ